MHIDHNSNKYGVIPLTLGKVGFIDFYEGMGALTRFFAASASSYKELVKVSRPESGTAYNCLECAFYLYCKAELKLLRAEHDEELPVD